MIERLRGMRGWHWAAAVCLIALGLGLLYSDGLIVNQARGDTEPLCNGEPYDPATEGCCNGSIYGLGVADCCEGKAVYVPPETCCCGGVVEFCPEVD